MSDPNPAMGPETREQAQARAEENRKQWVRFRGMWQEAVAERDKARERFRAERERAEKAEALWMAARDRLMAAGLPGDPA